MKAMRVAILTHEDLVPPENFLSLPAAETQHCKREYDMWQALGELGHEVRFLGVSDDLIPIRRMVEDWKPHAIFNLLMEFQDVGTYQVHVTSYLELLHVPYTGCNPKGILLTRDKATSKKILRFHRIPTPRFAVFRRKRRVRISKDLSFPLIVKSLEEEASLGISQASIVRSPSKLEERVAFVHEHIGDAIAEEYVEGRELTVSVLGNRRLTVFPPWELSFRNLPKSNEPIATEKVKWDLAYQEKLGVDTGPANLTPELQRRIATTARRLYRAFGLSGYARADLRLTPEGRVYVIEINATPDISLDEDFALSAAHAGIDYAALVQRILNLARRYQPDWKRASQ